MKIDRELYRRAYQAYRRAQEAESEERAQRAGTLSSHDAWQQYAGLVELCWRLTPQQSPRERHEHLAAWDRYYEAVQRLETWRESHGVES
jgi:hypothetical protein